MMDGASVALCHCDGRRFPKMKLQGRVNSNLFRSPLWFQHPAPGEPENKSYETNDNRRTLATDDSGDHPASKQSVKATKPEGGESDADTR
jgi:hypothetical protein